MTKWDLNEDKIDFLCDDKVIDKKLKGTYKIVIADDEEEVHRVTKLILNGLIFENMGLEFIDTYSGEETKKVLEENPDTAILFLDVVMEETHSGLHVVEYLRKDLDNKITRIVLRTGQPGEAPEEEIIRDYDINDYRIKTELTAKRLLTTLYASIRSYRDLLKLEKHKNGLEKIIRASASLFENNTLDKFLVSVLEELSSFQGENNNLVYMLKDSEATSNGFVSIVDNNNNKIVAATGKYEPYIGMAIEEVAELSHVYQHLNSERKASLSPVDKIRNGFIVSSQSNSLTNSCIYIDGDHETFDYGLINLFLSNFSIALDNFVLNNLVSDTQREIVYALAETVDSHFEETGSHTKRISNMMHKFALHAHFSFQEAKMLSIASSMHDLGKIAISDSILKKPGKLTEEEFNMIKTHTSHGYKILNGSGLPTLRMAAEIALNHHEKFDGTGYPGGLKGQNIPLHSRMMCIVDVYDAMTHKRVYKDAISREETIIEMLNNKGLHFDPNLLDVFINNLDDILSSSDLDSGIMIDVKVSEMNYENTYQRETSQLF